MLILYNLYISGIQINKTHEFDEVIAAFSRQFANRTPKLIALLNNPSEQCFFSNITDQQAQDIQSCLTRMGLVCRYRPSDHTSEEEFKLAPLEAESITCPYCDCKQKKPEKLRYHRCVSCSAKMLLFERRKRNQNNRHQVNRNRHLHLSSQLATLDENIDIKEPGQTAIEHAESVTREQRRTRTLYGTILGFTALSIIAIAVLAFFQAVNFSTDKSIDTFSRPHPLPQPAVAQARQDNIKPRSVNPVELTDQINKQALALLTEQKPVKSDHLAKQKTRFERPALTDVHIQRNELIASLSQQLQVESLLNPLSEGVDKSELSQIKVLLEKQITPDLALLKSSKNKATLSAVAMQTKTIQAILRLKKQVPGNQAIAVELSADKIISVIAQSPALQTVVEERLQRLNIQSGDVLIPKRLLSLAVDKKTVESAVNLTEIAKSIQSLALAEPQLLANSQLNAQIVKNIAVDPSAINNDQYANDLIRKIYAMEQLYQAQRAVQKKELTKKINSVSPVGNDHRTNDYQQNILTEKTFFQLKSKKTTLPLVGITTELSSTVLNLGLWQNQTNSNFFPRALMLGLKVK